MESGGKVIRNQYAHPESHTKEKVYSEKTEIAILEKLRQRKGLSEFLFGCNVP